MQELDDSLDIAIKELKLRENTPKTQAWLGEQLKSISENKIKNNPQLASGQKAYLLKTKMGSQKFHNQLIWKKGIVYYKNLKLTNLKRKKIYIDFLTHIKKDTFLIEGHFNTSSIEEIDIYVENPLGERVRAQKLMRKTLQNQSFGKFCFNETIAFKSKVNIPHSSKGKIKFIAKFKNNEQVLNIKPKPFTQLASLMLSYRLYQNRLFLNKASHIYVAQYTTLKHVLYELRFLLRLLFNWEIPRAISRITKNYKMRGNAQWSLKTFLKEIIISFGIVAEAVVMIPRALILRIAYFLSKKNKPIWLVSDRVTAAGDNGEAMFRYISKQKDFPAEVFFVLSKKVKDYERLKKYGKVIDQKSLRYKTKFLLADKIISSQADIETTNPFIRQINHFVDLYNFDFVFLQHGVIRHDLSRWLNRYEKNIQLFITSAQKEYDSIFSNPYYYEKKNVVLTGQPRFDYLENKPNRKIILAPTWRKSLALSRTDKMGRRKYDPNFKKSDFFKFYNNLINDKRITDELNRQNMLGEFYLHPVFEAQRKDFNGNGTFKIMDFPYSYNKAFSEGELLISDHSSVVFDFAYMKKPVMYAHFDAETFFENHSYDKSNFFSDENDGFGEIYYDYETLVEGIIRSLQDGCKMPQKYKSRVDKFFYKIDKNNSKRVYDLLIKNKGNQ